MKYKAKWRSKEFIGLTQIWQLVNGIGRTHGLWFIDIFACILCFIIKHKRQRQNEKIKL